MKRDTNDSEILMIQRPWSRIAAIVLLLILEGLFFYLCLSGIEVLFIEIAYALMIVLALAVICLILDFVFWSLRYDNGVFQTRTWYGKRKEYKRIECKQILEYYSLPQQRMALAFYFNDGKKIAVNEAYRGYQLFHTYLKRRKSIK